MNTLLATVFVVFTTIAVDSTSGVYVLSEHGGSGGHGFGGGAGGGYGGGYGSGLGGGSGGIGVYSAASVPGVLHSAPAAPAQVAVGHHGGATVLTTGSNGPSVVNHGGSDGAVLAAPGAGPAIAFGGHGGGAGGFGKGGSYGYH